MAPGDSAPEATQTPTLTVEALVAALQGLRGQSQAAPGDRYRLQPPNFGGEGDVEQFIKEFEDVATIAEWPARVRILQLRACLTGRARSFALGPDEAHIKRALRARFGCTTEEAADRLQALRRDRKTPLEDHANEVERLAQAAFGHATGADRRHLVYSAFFRSVNHPDLQRYWLAARVRSLEEALEMGKAYFQVEEPGRPSYAARQVVREDEETTPSPTPQVAATATEPTQLTMLIDMVKGLQATVTKLQRDQADRRTPRSRDDPVRPSLLTCWGCGMQGHVRRHCPKGQGSLNTQGSR